MAWSKMGKQRKSEDKVFEFHQAWATQRKLAKTAITVFENVPEYEIEILRKEFAAPRFQLMAVTIDPRLLGQGVARPRVFALILDTLQVRWTCASSFHEVVQMMRMRTTLGAKDYFWMSCGADKLTVAQRDNLKAYEENGCGTFCDLNQYAKNGRGRCELVDGCLMTLTTNSSNIYNRDWLV